MTYSVLFGKWTKIIRRQRNLTQEQLAERAGFSAVHISEIERGKKRVLLDTAIKIASALEVPITVFTKEIPLNEDYIVSTPNFDILIESSRNIQNSLVILQNFMQELTGPK